jgi:PAS domain S-box-containing protein
LSGEPVVAPVPVQRSSAPVRIGSAVPALDRLADLARRLLGTAAAQVRLVPDAGARLAPGARTGALGDGGCDGLCALTTSTASALALPDALLDPRSAHLPAVRAGTVRSYLGVPLVTEGGTAVGALCVHDPAPRAWDEADVELLSQLAASVVAELQLVALSGAYQQSVDRWELAIDAAGVGSFDWDLVSGQLLWDDRLLALFGYAADDFGRSIADFEARLHPDDVARVRRVLAAAAEDCDSWEMEYRVALPDGRVRWVTARGRALRGPSGAAERMLGAAYDSTDVRDSQARTLRVLETMSAAFYSLDTDWRFTYVNAEAERILGRDREELLGGVLWELFPATVGSDFEVHYRDAVTSGQTRTFEAYYPAPLDGWYELRAWPSPDGLSVYFLDVSGRRAAQRSLQAAVRRAHLVADVTTELSATLDAELAVARLAALLVPELADYCLVTLVDDQQGLRDVGWAHADPDLEQVTARYSSLRMGALKDSSFVGQAMRTGEPVLIEQEATARIARVFEPGEARDLLHVLAPQAAAILPMQARGRTVGLVSLFRTHPGRPYDADELATARDVAARAALALDNARLFALQRELAEQLQHSLLTPPPEPDHLEVVVRYVPAARAAQVGGDWYDAFVQPDGATMLVIGDVVGHDTAAAAAMGQVRGLLRGIAYTTEQGPADVLTRLDQAIEGLQVGTTATAVAARLEQTDEERENALTCLRWSNAGHPPPMVLDADGSVRVLAGAEADLLLGLDPTSARTETRAMLGRDSTVLLYTDGLVERRGQSLDEGLDRLRAALTELRHLPLAELCDELLTRLLPSAREDDVAMVAVRLHPQDAPRPPEAGPAQVPPRVPRSSRDG